MIEAKGIRKTFDNFVALDNVDCRIPEGSIYGMVGTNGAGKSTLIRVLTGVYKPEAGTAMIDGQQVYENPDVKKNVVYVADELYFIAGSNMKRMAKLYKSVYENFDMDRFNFLTEQFGLDPKKNLNTFSKGMRRQAAIILALSTRAKYMFFDETFDGLDPVMRNLIKGIISQDVIEKNTTAILTSHSLRELEDTCDQLVLLHKGGIILESDVTDLKTSLFKIQIAFAGDYDLSLFDGIDIIHSTKSGSVSNLIVKGDREAMIEKLSKLNPVIMDILPLSLEEVFTYEVEALGYDFSGVFEEVPDEK